MAPVGRYELLAEVARGGMGVVHRARTPDGQEVALKLLLAGKDASPLHRRRAATEIQSLLRIRHPHVVALLDAGEHEGVPYVVMEWIEGESLGARLARGGPLDPGEAVELVARLADALAHCHRLGVIHRDLKPDNVLIRAADGAPLLVDFGIAKDVASEHHTTIMKTTAGRWLGTPGWWPPEQARGELSAVGPRSDVYGLGAVLYGALTGSPPQEGKSLPEIFAALLKPPVPPRRRSARVPPWLDALCLRALELDPAHRPAGAEELARELRAGGAAKPAASSRRLRYDSAPVNRPSEMELAFLENLRLLGVPAPHLIYLLRLREQDERQAWVISAELELAAREVLNEAYKTAEAALEEAGGRSLELTPGTAIGPWELVAPKGRAVGGEAWVARKDGRPALLRLVWPGTGQDPERVQRWSERSNPGLEPPHPSILRIDEAGEDDGWLWTSTRGFEGGTLAEILGKGPLAEASAIALAQSIAGSLQVVHGLGVVHGGLNPLSVLVQQSRTYLSDFGLCSGVLDGAPAGQRPGGRLGPLLYASPGLVAGSSARGLESKDDVYSLGAVVYHALVTATPGAERAAPDAPWLVEPPCSQGLRAVLARLLAPHPDARYPSVAALLPDLARAAQGQLPGPLPGPGQSVVSRRAATAAPQVVLTAALLRGEEEPEPPKKGASGRTGKPSDRLEKKASGRQAKADPEPEAAPEKKSDRLGKKSDRLGKVSDRLAKRGASDRFAAPKAKGAGWVWLAGALLVVGGGLLLAVSVAKPDGAPLARQHLLRAGELLGQTAPPWAAAQAEVDAALAAAPRDLPVVRDALAIAQEIRRRSAAEVAAVTGEADPDEAKLRALGARVAGLEVEPLIELALAVKTGEKELPTWGGLGERLLRQGHAAGATQAFQRAGRDADAQRARLASELAWLPGGPWLVLPEPKGDGKPAPTEPALVRRAGSWLGRTEVTRAEYREFLAARPRQPNPHGTCHPGEPAGKDHAPEGWSPRSGPDDPYPATGLDWWDATSYARWRGGALPDVATLEAAARGPQWRPFPWGALPPALGLANAGGELSGVAPAGSFLAGAGTGGALDLLGNAEEWADVTTLGVIDQAPVFGGSWETPWAELGPTATKAPAGEKKPGRGFRIALPVEPEP